MASNNTQGVALVNYIMYCFSPAHVVRWLRQCEAVGSNHFARHNAKFLMLYGVLGSRGIEDIQLSRMFDRLRRFEALESYQE